MKLYKYYFSCINFSSILKDFNNVFILLKLELKKYQLYDITKNVLFKYFLSCYHK